MNRAWSVRPGWSPVTVGLMVLGFIIAWPLGLAVLAYILWGDRLHTFMDEARYRMGTRRAGNTGNLAFDDYREQELKRLEEERRKLDAMREEFDAFMHELRRAKDKDEFDRFMNERRTRDGDRPSGFGSRPEGAPA